MLKGYFFENNYPPVWEFQQAIPIHDSGSRFQDMMIARLSASYLQASIDAIKGKYLDLQLTLDWMRHPLKRGDTIATSLHCTTSDSFNYSPCSNTPESPPPPAQLRNHIQEPLSFFLRHQPFKQHILYTAAAFVVTTLLEQKLAKPGLDGGGEAVRLSMHRMMRPERLPAERIEAIIDQHLQGLCTP
ncbi:hypothetical protein [Paenibacillus thiaminolyticus]|uniref:hypothetical protein n=1 Tax=Paenibacillus thiaminolyticus TaxID=49283 RepID=UPI0015FFD8CC|nr:hypothetical protein [Paenibacillus thiaminolyticus]